MHEPKLLDGEVGNSDGGSEKGWHPPRTCLTIVPTEVRATSLHYPCCVPWVPATTFAQAAYDAGE